VPGNWFVTGSVTLLIMYCDCGTCYFPNRVSAFHRIIGMGVKVVVRLVEDLFHHFLGTEKTTTRFLCCPRDEQITRWEC
jgi:predicted xylose isomerase-like sugar epimerase